MNSNPLSNQNLQDMMERYRQEMMQIRNRSTLPPEPEEEAPRFPINAEQADSMQENGGVEYVPAVPMPLVTEEPEPAPMPPVQPASPRTPLPFTPPETVDDLPMRNNPPAVTEEPEEPMYFIPGEETPAMDLEEPAGDVNEQLREEMMEGMLPNGSEMDITGNAPDLIPIETTYPPEDDLATLQVRVYTARGAVPIQNAVVTITGKNPDNDLQYVALTDENGFSPPVVLPAVDRKLTLQPSENIPVTTYDVLVVAPGYFRVRNRNVPVYGGTSAVQPVELIPLPELTDGTEEQTFYGSGPQDL